MNEFIRRLDGLGRIVIPKEFRKVLKINNDSKLKITEENNYIKIEKYSDIDKNLEILLRLKNTIKKELDLEVIMTDTDTILEKDISLSRELISKIKYGKAEILNNSKDIIFNTNEELNIIIKPIMIYGEIIGSIIGYSKKREIDDLDKKILEIAVSILIKDIEE